MENVSASFPPLKSKSAPRWVWFVLFGIMLAGAGVILIWWYAKQEAQVSAVQQKFDQEIAWKLSAAMERKEIRKGISISGEVQGASKDLLGFLLKNPAGQGGVFRVALTPKTKLYRLSNDEIPERITLTIDDLSPGSFVTVVSDEKIGRKDMIQALEVLKLR